MDLVVWFALGTLGVVFCLAFIILLALIWRRRQQNKALAAAEGNFKFTREEKVGKLVELVPLMDRKLTNCDWAEGVEGPFLDVIAILRLTTGVVKILADVGVSRASSKIYEVIAQAMFRVDTHFHELLEFTPTQGEDIKVIEARALTLTTTVWALNAAFTLHGFDKAKEVEEQVIKMYEHVDNLRQLIPEYLGRRDAARGEEEEKTESQATEETNASGETGPSALVEPGALPPSINIQEVVAEVNTPPEGQEETVVPAAAAATENGEETEAATDAVAPPPPSTPPPEANGSPTSSPTKSDSAPPPTTNGTPPKVPEEPTVPKEDTVEGEDGEKSPLIPPPQS